MDLLTHLYLPPTVAYGVRPDLFSTPWHLGVGVVGGVLLTISVGIDARRADTEGQRR